MLTAFHSFRVSSPPKYAWFLTVGGNQSTWRQPKQILGDHENSPQNGTHPAWFSLLGGRSTIYEYIVSACTTQFYFILFKCKQSGFSTVFGRVLAMQILWMKSPCRQKRAALYRSGGAMPSPSAPSRSSSPSCQPPTQVHPLFNSADWPVWMVVIQLEIKIPCQITCLVHHSSNWDYGLLGF